MSTFLIKHPVLGDVEIRRRSNAIRFIARRRAGRYIVTVPSDADTAGILGMLDYTLPRLIKLAEAVATRYTDGYTFRAPGWVATITTDPGFDPGRMIMKRLYDEDTGEAQFVITVAPDTDFDSHPTIKSIANMLRSAARSYTDTNLLPEARAMAAELGVRPREWRISGGISRLGFCSASGRVSLSALTAMLPVELRRYVITHELAHLTHFDHSPAFHALWRQYLGCDPAPLKIQLRNFKWPI